MSVPVALGSGLLAAVSASAAWIMWRADAGRLTSALTAAFSGLLLTALVVGSTGVSANVPGLLAAAVVGPLALAAYPRIGAGGSRGESWLILALVLVVGLVMVSWPASREILPLATCLLLIGHFWWVLEQGPPRVRTAAGWTAAASVAAVVSTALFSFTFEAFGGDETASVVTTMFALLVLLLVPTAMAVGAVNPDVVDVRWLATTLTVTLTVLVCFLGAASMVVYGIEVIGGAPPTTSAVIVVCGLLALAVAPARAWLYGTIEQLLFGGRPDPITALATVADTMGDDLAAALDTLRSALVLPYVRLEVAGRPPVIAGHEIPHVTRLPLDHGSGAAGALVVGRRPGERRWSREDLGVLGLVVPLLASTVRAQLLADEVVVSRSEAVTGIEEERRRLRRDLHDGLGPTLTGVAFSADAARNLVRRDPAAAEALLMRLRSDTSDAIAEVRRLVEGLRPPALDELGLVGALKIWADGLYAAGGAKLAVDFHGEDRLCDLSAAGEVAAYRIAVEALTNAARHSGSAEASVSFSRRADALVLEIADHGVGGDWSPGVGLAAMRERAELVGGRIEAGGGQVRAVLPAG